MICQLRFSKACNAKSANYFYKHYNFYKSFQQPKLETSFNFASKEKLVLNQEGSLGHDSLFKFLFGHRNLTLYKTQQLTSGIFMTFDNPPSLLALMA